MPVSKALLQGIAVTAELTGTELSEPAARAMAEELARYPEGWVVGALKRCQRELRSRMTLADVLSRLEDGRPGPEEAWAICPRDEAVTVVWTEEMRLAWGAAYRLIEEGDEVAARMTFRERYGLELQRAREKAQPPKWSPSLGHDRGSRDSVILEAVKLGRLSQEHALAILPPEAFDQSMTKALPVPRENSVAA